MIKQFPDDSDSIAGDTIYAATAKSTPVDADKIGYWDSVSGLFRSMTWANVTATLLTYFTDKGIGAYNDILNGNFQRAQRGTSFAAAAHAAYDLDGWMTSKAGAAVFTIDQTAGSVAGRKCRQTTITTADASIAAGDAVFDLHIMIGYDIVKYVGNTFVVFFRAKFPVTGIHCVALRNRIGDRSYVHELTVAAADTWADYSFVVTGGLPTAGTWEYGAAAGLQLTIAHACGSTFQTATTDAWVAVNVNATANQVNDCATVGNVWALEEVKLNLGTVPTQHQISEAEMLVRCQQRCRKLIFSVATVPIATFQCISTTQAVGAITQVPSMLGALTITPSAAATFDLTTANNAAIALTALNMYVYDNTIYAYPTVAGGLVAGDATLFRSAATTASILITSEPA
jgi:hypothetical protein